MSQMSSRRGEVVWVNEGREANDDWRCHTCGHYFVLNHGPRGCTFPVLKEGIVEQCRCNIRGSADRRDDGEDRVMPITEREREDMLGYRDAGASPVVGRVTCGRGDLFKLMPSPSSLQSIAWV